MVVNKSKQSSRTRSLYLLDTENLTGMPAPTEPALVEARRAVERVAPTGVGDLVIVGASSGGGALRSGLAWAGARVVLRRGKDGADLALIDAAEPDFVSERFERLVIGSGDGAFTDHAAAVARRGVHVVVLTRRDALAPRLALAAHEVRFIDDTTEPATSAMEVRHAG